MTRRFEVVHPDARLDRVALRLEDPGHPALLVCEHDRLVGVLDRDAVRLALRPGRGGARATRVRDAMAPEFLYCLESTDVAEAAALMREHRAPWIPVLGADHRLVGVVALASLPPEVEPSSTGR